MKENKRLKPIGLMFALLLSIFILMPHSVFAASLDDLAQQSQDGTTQQSTQQVEPSAQSDETAGVLSDYLHNYNAVTDTQMQQAQTYASPIVNIIGVLSGLILTLASAAIFLVTAFDLLYIGVPLVRPYIDGGKTQAMSGGAGMSGMGMGGMGMGGMGMHGMGMRGMGGMGMGGMSGGQPAPAGSKFCLVSDEAVNCVLLAQQSAQPPMAGGMAGGMGMGMGMGMPQQQPQIGTKSIMWTYLKKRSIFLVLFFVAMIVLMSSVFTDCGINLAQLFMKIMNNVNGTISNVQI